MRTARTRRSIITPGARSRALPLTAIARTRRLCSAPGTSASRGLASTQSALWHMRNRSPATLPTFSQTARRRAWSCRKRFAAAASRSTGSSAPRWIWRCAAVSPLSSAARGAEKAPSSAPSWTASAAAPTSSPRRRARPRATSASARASAHSPSTAPSA